MRSCELECIASSMVKRILWALFCLVFTLTGYASQLTATLQSGDKLTPFYGSNALVDAYNAAVDGDIIILSPGTFNTAEITKGITIIGSYAFSDDTSLSTVLDDYDISANNVTIEGIRVNGTITIKGADNLTIKRSYICMLSDAENVDKKYHDNTIITDCMIVAYRAMSLSKNTVLRNCGINYFEYGNNESANLALIENCSILRFFQSGNTLEKNIPFAIYRNCCLGIYIVKGTKNVILSLFPPSEFHDCAILYLYEDANDSNYLSKSISWDSCTHSNILIEGTEDSYYKTNLYPFRPWKKPVEVDGEYHYIYYGPSDHKEYPAIPTITSSEIGTETDDNGNLHVKISAETRD